MAMEPGIKEECLTGNGIPDVINTLAAFGQRSNQVSGDDQLLGVCTTIVPKAVLDLMGNNLNDVCQQSDISMGSSPLGMILFGNVTGLQKAEGLIKAFKNKTQNLCGTPKEENGISAVQADVEDKYSNQIYEETHSIDTPHTPETVPVWPEQKESCTITIKDSTTLVQMPEEQSSKPIMVIIPSEGQAANKTVRKVTDTCDSQSQKTSALHVEVLLKGMAENSPQPASNHVTEEVQCSDSEPDDLSDSVSTPVNYPCVQCGKVFSTDNDLQEHRSRGRCDRPTEKPPKRPSGCVCCVCSIKLPTAKLLAIHMEKLHDNQVPNEAEKAKVKVTQEVTGHVEHRRVNQAEEAKEFVAVEANSPIVTNKSSSPGVSIRRVKSTGNNNGGNRYLCDLCGKAFHSRSGIRLHRRMCSTGIADKPQPKVHKELDYAEMGFNIEELQQAAGEFPVEYKYIHQCNLCTYTSTYKGLEKHIIRCHGDKQWPCPLCSRMFTRKWEITDHMRVAHKTKYREKRQGDQSGNKVNTSERLLSNTSQDRLSTDAAVDSIQTYQGNGTTPIHKSGRLVAEQTEAELTEAEEGAAKKRTSRTDQTIVSCIECNYECTKYGLTNHMLYHTGNHPYSCIICEKNMSVVRMLRLHLARHFHPHTKRLVIPKTAGLTKTKPQCLISEGGVYLCHECGSKFNNAHKLLIHKRGHEADRRSNLQIVYSTKAVPKQCDCPGATCQSICGEKLVDVQVKKYACPEPGCDILLLRAGDVKRHIRDVHKEAPAGSCFECGKVFKHLKNLEVHIRRSHHKEQHVFCPNCGKGFFDNTRLREHMEIHKDKALRKNMANCEVCGKMMSVKHLKHHINTHTGERPHECQLCKKRFPFSAGLHRHMQHIHSTEKPYVCPHPGCDKAFKVGSKLKYHMTIHTGVSKHKCERCDKVFTQRSTLRKHLQQHCEQTQQTGGPMQVKPEPDTTEPVLQLDKVFSLNSELPAEESQLFMCSVCQATFVYFEDIEKHLSVHDTETMEIALDNVYQPDEAGDLTFQPVATHSDLQYQVVETGVLT